MPTTFLEKHPPGSESQKLSLFPTAKSLEEASPLCTSPTKVRLEPHHKADTFQNEKFSTKNGSKRPARGSCHDSWDSYYCFICWTPGNLWEDSGNPWEDSGNLWEDSGNLWEDSGNLWEDSIWVSSIPQIFHRDGSGWLHRLRIWRVLELGKPLLDTGWMESMITRQPLRMIFLLTNATITKGRRCKECCSLTSQRLSRGSRKTCSNVSRSVFWKLDQDKFNSCLM